MLQTQDITERVKRYWTFRAKPQKSLRDKELASGRSQAWTRYIVERAPVGRSLDVLDVGTGTGYLALLMAERGYNVTGVDLVPAMLAQAKVLAAARGLAVPFQEMNAQRLEFDDDSFDLLLSRNLVWTLPDPEAAFAEWKRVLRPGGVLLYFDADYGSVCFEQECAGHKYNDCSIETLRECDDIKQSLRISGMARPEWDGSVLKSMGFINVQVDTDLNGRFFAKTDDFYNPVPMFSVTARKR